MLSILAIFLMIAVQTQELETQLLQALRGGYVQQVKTFLEAGANPNAKTEEALCGSPIPIARGRNTTWAKG